MNSWRTVADATRGEYRRFLDALNDPGLAQRRLLMDILSVNADTAFGRAHGFARLRGIDDYRRAVPIQRYEDVQPDIEAMLRGEGGLRVAEPVLLYEQTGGSSGGAKTIPYTARSLEVFKAALHPWLHDLALAWPDLEGGRAYWSISPAGRAKRRSAAGPPIGMDNDLAYFGEAAGSALGKMSAVPGVVAQAGDMDTWRYLTLRYLLDCDGLSLISVWSPTFLTALLQGMEGQEERLLRDVADGAISLDASLPAGFAPRPDRAAQLAQAFAKSPVDTGLLWPRLTLISCWTHGAAARFIPGLRKLFPRPHIQGKGLLATEGAVSIPLHGSPYPVLALHSGFFEFVDERGDSLLAHEVFLDGIYRLIMTTPGGLYRYDLGDQVRIRGWRENSPLLEFIGRAGAVSDLCGEKLTDAAVAGAMPAGSGFAVLAPETDGPLRYRLLLDAGETAAADAAAQARRLDEALRRNPQYDYARRLGQLAAVEATRLQAPATAYTEWGVRRGQRLGDIKIPILYCSGEWRKVFGVAADTIAETEETPWNPE